jgi:hypothetical protein
MSGPTLSRTISEYDASMVRRSTVDDATAVDAVPIE